MPQFALIASAIVGAVGTVASVSQARKSAALQQRQSALQNRNSQRQAIREAQIRRAQATQSAVAGGANLGSGLAGGMASLGSQLGSSLGYSTQMSGLNSQISMANANAQTYSDVGQFGFKAFNYFSGGQGFNALLPKALSGRV
jgi:hypothetical protein